MTAKAMEGPWEVEHFVNPVGGCNTTTTRIRRSDAKGGERYRVCTLGVGRAGDATDLATANLIAAAPDLLAALERAMLYCNEPLAEELAEAAIAKARGN